MYLNRRNGSIWWKDNFSLEGEEGVRPMWLTSLLRNWLAMVIILHSGQIHGWGELLCNQFPRLYMITNNGEERIAKVGVGIR